MKSRPILFSAPMVRALLDGTKAQTRRVVKNTGLYAIDAAIHGQEVAKRELAALATQCPHGVPGDRLWVREEHFRFGHWEPVPGVRTKGGRQKWKFVADTPEVRYNDNAPEAFRKGRHHKDPETPAWHKRLARFMPRSASRITLELTAVRVERLQDISEADAVAEGIIPVPKTHAWGHQFWRDYRLSGDGTFCVDNPIDSYRSLWESLNGPGSWDANPYVWVETFRRVEP